MKIEDRRIRLLYLLRSGLSSFTSNLAEALDVSRRTIFRDIDALCNQGIPIGFDPERGYFIEEKTSVPTIKLTHKELQILSLGLSFIASQPDEMLKKEGQFLISKMMHSMPSDASSILYGLLEKTRINPDLLQKEISTIPWNLLLDAILKRNVVVFSYRKLNSERIEKRKLLPQFLSFYSDHWTLEGQDLEREAVRSFRISNISDFQLLKDKADSIPNKKTKFAVVKKNYRIIISFNNSLIRDSFRQKLPTKILAEYTKGDKKIVEFEFSELSFINKFLLQFGSDISVIAPVELLSYRLMELQAMIKNEANFI